jgi:hypothetical protein
LLFPLRSKHASIAGLDKHRSLQLIIVFGPTAGKLVNHDFIADVSKSNPNFAVSR